MLRGNKITKVIEGGKRKQELEESKHCKQKKSERVVRVCRKRRKKRKSQKNRTLLLQNWIINKLSEISSGRSFLKVIKIHK
jgi:hypothetical protein